ncbi:hypothetical protein BUALT_Bualt06G0058100 [Buddleja alternifolia]|uniref:Uncharacterized protein n=1 Tax=Buddleja alternifolia TaxID=168488 RepID=A0AAV6XEI0_9LAMI|nr:hypothetical protein BUALT_Bualt06G0058100 [Buddleja alternifolia]
MALPPTASQPNPTATTNFETDIPTPMTYMEKLKVNTWPQEIVVWASKKTFVHGMDLKVIGTSALFNGKKTIFLLKEEDGFMATPYQYSLAGEFSNGYPTMTRLRAT